MRQGSMMKALRYAKRLIGFESTSHLSNRVVASYLERKLRKYGFITERIEYRDDHQVRKVNLIAKKGSGSGGLAYFAHNDVVPADQWFSDKFGPFEPAIARDRLYGRGACDMKGSIACMLAAIQLFEDSDLQRPFYFACTADEEIGFTGAKHLVEESKFYREMVAGDVATIIGEPTLLDVVHAHKGSYVFRVTSRGKAAHSSTNEGHNANLAMIPFLAEMKEIHDAVQTDPAWQDDQFSPSSMGWNIGVNDHTPAVNMTPGQSECTVHFRPMPGQDTQPLIDRARAAAETHGLHFEVERDEKPFLTDPSSPFVQQALELAHRQQPLTVSYGTDACVLSELENVIVFGPGNIAQAHTQDEWIAMEQLSLGTEMYTKFIRHFCG